MSTYIVKRTGRRCTPRGVPLSTGDKFQLNATGSHVFTGSAEDAALIAAVPGTKVIEVRPTVAVPAPAPKKAKKAKGKKKA